MPARHTIPPGTNCQAYWRGECQLCLYVYLYVINQPVAHVQHSCTFGKVDLHQMDEQDSQEREERLRRRQELERQRRARETAEQREIRLARRREQYRARRLARTFCMK